MVLVATKIDGKIYHVHPVYDLYGVSFDGEIIHMINHRPLKGGTVDKKNGISIVVQGFGSPFKTVLKHQFIYEAFNDVIPEGGYIKHLNNDKKDNRLCNLRPM